MTTHDRTVANDILRVVEARRRAEATDLEARCAEAFSLTDPDRRDALHLAVIVNDETRWAATEGDPACQWWQPEGMVAFVSGHNSDVVLVYGITRDLAWDREYARDFAERLLGFLDLLDGLAT